MGNEMKYACLSILESVGVFGSEWKDTLVGQMKAFEIEQVGRWESIPFRKLEEKQYNFINQTEAMSLLWVFKERNKGL